MLSLQNPDQEEYVQVSVHETPPREVYRTIRDLGNAHERAWLIWVYCFQHVKKRKIEYLLPFYLLLV